MGYKFSATLTDPNLLNIIVERLWKDDEIEFDSILGKDLTPRPPSGKGLTSRPPSGKYLIPRPPSGKNLTSRLPSGKDLTPRPPSGKDLTSRPPSGKDLTSRPPSSRDKKQESKQPKSDYKYAYTLAKYEEDLLVDITILSRKGRTLPIPLVK